MAAPSDPLETQSRILSRCLGRVERRLRLARVLDFLITAVALGLLATAATLLLHKLGRLPDDGWRLLALGVLSLGFVLTATGWLLPVDRAHAAKRLDQAGELADRCTAAHAFLESRAAERDPFARATVADAAEHAPRVRPAHAAPLPWPRDLRLALMLAAVVVVIGLVRPPAALVAATVSVRTTARSGMTPPDLSERREELKALLQDPELAKDPELQKFADELQKLFDALEQKKLTRKEAFEKIAALEKKYFEGKDGDFEALKDRIRKMGGLLARDKVAEELGRALQQGNLEKARREIEKLAEKLEDKKMSAPERKRLARALERAAQQERNPQEQRKEELRRDIKKLEREQKDKPNEERKKRLERQKRELKRLERDVDQKREKEQQAERQLKRLQRELEEAAQQMMNQLDKKSAEALRKAMEQVSRLQNEIRKVGGRQKAQGQLADLKEILRRLKAGGKIRLGQLDDFNNRAGGKRKGQGQGQGDNDVTLLPGGSGAPKIPMPGMGKGGQGPKGTQPGQDRGGQQAGVGHDPNTLGAATQLKARRSEKLIDGTQGAGPTRSEVILGASEKGFSNRSYRRVYRDYTGVVEDVLKKEKVPLGYKFYVKRYFNLIKPRE